MVKPQHLSAFLVFLSTIFSGKQPLLYRLRETKLPPSPWFCPSTDDQRPLKTPAVQRMPRVVLMADVIVQGVYWVTDTLLASWYPTYMQTFIISHSSCAEQYGDMSSDTQTHTHTHTHRLTHTIKPPTAGVHLVGHTTYKYLWFDMHH